MNWKNDLTQILKISYPIIQGPFGGGYSSISLSAAVTNLGGMGSFGAHHLSHDEILTLDNQLKTNCKGTYAINLWVKNDNYKDFSNQDFEKTKAIFKPYFEELNIPVPDKPVLTEGHSFDNQLEAILKTKPPVFSFVFGVPDESIIKECKKRGILTLGTATTVEEAVLLEDAKVDAIVATGFEAGGHRVAFEDEPENNLIGNISLIPRVVDAVKTPVIAAGGIADGRGIAAAMVLGAKGVQIGTAFLACQESNASIAHKKVLFSQKAEKTVLTKSFTGRLARGTDSTLARETLQDASKLAPYPIQGQFMRSLRNAALQNNRLELISFWCGQSAPLIKSKTAKGFFTALKMETESVFNEMADIA
ncbi:NAD(P)H-dependent flavin oxidoreductase [Flagellimonas lutimaris]|uniref:NAD(P)H-dependent flavin oxidoreductase n=1 Tax=Flagellimonas lutimaris TaxID=475082 RepID=UPI003F5CCF31